MPGSEQPGNQDAPDPRVTELLGVVVDTGLGKAVPPRDLEGIGSPLAFGKSLGGPVLRGPLHGHEPLQSFPRHAVLTW
jgi:hypothetical protein